MAGDLRWLWNIINRAGRSPQAALPPPPKIRLRPMGVDTTNFHPNKNYTTFQIIQDGRDVGKLNAYRSAPNELWVDSAWAGNPLKAATGSFDDGTNQLGPAVVREGARQLKKYYQELYPNETFDKIGGMRVSGARDKALQDAAAKGFTAPFGAGGIMSTTFKPAIAASPFMMPQLYGDQSQAQAQEWPQAPMPEEGNGGMRYGGRTYYR